MGFYATLVIAGLGAIFWFVPDNLPVGPEEIRSGQALCADAGGLQSATLQQSLNQRYTGGGGWKSLRAVCADGRNVVTRESR